MHIELLYNKSIVTDYLNDDDCLQTIFDYNFGDMKACPGCGDVNPKYYRVRGRMAYCCKECRHQIYPLAGTMFEKSHTPLSVWFKAVDLVEANHKIPSFTLAGELGVTYRTAWRMRAVIISATVLTAMEGPIMHGLVVPVFRHKSRGLEFLTSFELTTEGKKALGRA